MAKLFSAPLIWPLDILLMGISHDAEEGPWIRGTGEQASGIIDDEYRQDSR
jgi:hypothetical protein